MSGISSDKEIKIVFDGFQRANASLGFPAASSLVELLNAGVQKAEARNHTSFSVELSHARMFASAAIEMWHRAVHSFIVSAGLTQTSPLWASVAGYYSTHYSLRAHAHLIGRYVLYRLPRVVSLELASGRFHCTIARKSGASREHKVYRRFVHESPLFEKDPFLDVEIDFDPQSDSAHRNKANYHDHINSGTPFRALSEIETADRISRISEIQINALPIPDAGKYPDLESVQLMAYHRLIRFRRFMDGLFGEDNRFWRAHRKPGWCASLMDFQFVEPRLSPGEQSS